MSVAGGSGCTRGGQSAGSGRGLVQRSVVEVGLWHVVLPRLKVHHRQHGVHNPRQRVIDHHGDIIPATGFHEHAVDEYAVPRLGELFSQITIVQISEVISCV